MLRNLVELILLSAKAEAQNARPHVGQNDQLYRVVGDSNRVPIPVSYVLNLNGADYGKLLHILRPLFFA
jgi:hypothetical protein